MLQRNVYLTHGNNYNNHIAVAKIYLMTTEATNEKHNNYFHFWRSQISWPHGGSNWPTSKYLDFLFGSIFKYKGSSINPREMCFVHFRTHLPLSLVILLPFLLRLCVVPSRHNSEEHNYLTRHFRRNELNPTTGNVFMH